jgi:hypothetical protein
MNLNEPTQYEAEFFYSKKEKLISTSLGFFLIIVGVAVKLKEFKDSWIPVALIIGGIFFAYMGIREIINKKPKLKLARKGLWTKRLGFVDWNDIAKTQIMKIGIGFNRPTILEIYLKKLGVKETDKPDELFDLTNIENKEYVEIIIDDFKNKRNETKA